MKFTFLGSGSAFTLGKENYHSNILIEAHCDYINMPANVLYDAGTTLPDALDLAGYLPTDIDSVFLSHNHADHNGGLEYLGFKNYFSTFPFGENKPTLWGHHVVLEELWENSLKAGMRSLQEKTASLDTYFEPIYMKDSDEFRLTMKIKCEPVQTIHVIDDRRFMPSYGLMVTDEESDTRVFISGDTQLAPNQMMSFYDHSDVIFHDCEIAEYPNSVHAQYHELKKLPEAIRAKMWLYHYTTNNGEIELPDAVADGFRGFVKRGDTFEF